MNFLLLFISPSQKFSWKGHWSAKKISNKITYSCQFNEIDSF